MPQLSKKDLPSASRFQGGWLCPTPSLLKMLTETSVAVCSLRLQVASGMGGQWPPSAEVGEEEAMLSAHL